ncbi:MAG: DUF2670 domain-containing protein [Rickettsiales bacterium]|nr:MAG: DUF2670 domain-containing protein [Rickettsiales bacterium]
MPDDFYFSPKLQKILKGYRGKWVYMLFAKWYLLVAIPALTAAYYFLISMDRLGLMNKLYNFIDKHLSSAVKATKACTPLIGNIKEFLDCISNF